VNVNDPTNQALFFVLLEKNQTICNWTLLESFAIVTRRLTKEAEKGASRWMYIEADTAILENLARS
jgi:hypothetical protein